MTKRDALAEARRRWGQEGAVRLQWIPGTKGDTQRRVGYRFDKGNGIGGFVICGTGDTWAAAFADADQREQRKEE